MRTEQEMILEMLKDNFRGTKSYTPKKRNTYKVIYSNCCGEEPQGETSDYDGVILGRCSACQENCIFEK